MPLGRGGVWGVSLGRGGREQQEARGSRKRGVQRPVVQPASLCARGGMG